MSKNFINGGVSENIIEDELIVHIGGLEEFIWSDKTPLTKEQIKEEKQELKRLRKEREKVKIRKAKEKIKAKKRKEEKEKRKRLSKFYFMNKTAL